MDRLRIVFTDTIGDLRHPGQSGFSDFAWGISRELTKLGHDVRIVGLYPSDFDIEAGDVKITAVTPSRRRNIATYIWDLARVTRAAATTEADVVHTFDCTTAGMLCALRTHRRVAYHGNMNVRGHRKRVQKLPWSRSMYAFMRVGTTIACRRAARIISLGPSLNEGWIEAGTSPDRISVLPNPIVPTDRVERVPDTEALLYVGRLSREKGGVIELIQALSYLPESVRLTIAGSGPMRSELERFLQTRRLCHRVEFLGHQTPAEVRALYARSTLVVLPSVNEMLPRVMQEAWNAGVAFAGTPVGAVPDYLKDGVNGYVISSNDPQVIADTIRRALYNAEERHRIEVQALDSVQEMSVNQITQRLITEVYEPIIKGNEATSAKSKSARAERVKRVIQ